MKHLFALLLPLLAALGLFEPREQVAETAPEPTHNLAWMEGHWTGQGLGGTIEEVWLSPANGSMVGTFRLIQNGKVAFYELITITDRPGDLSMVLRHFHADLKGWEEKNEPLVWEGERLADGALRFGPVVYEPNGKDGMRIQVELGEGGQSHVEHLSVTRVK